eukprot:CAMPEP_0116137314 /NCGR_PEP_ID=MMETSP0329-20121206/12185_1 /TAXON_ID=697910 /ORGANISM="Pseudo-nitzschia arenysensis, Strain B593" /LENGTH=391 /DNA_ID=CAMNT_0003632227 /DNA_START=266 /DNA_END=1442 /DNA_ORIENTATION=+
MNLMNSTNTSAVDTAADDVGGGRVNEKIRQYRPKSLKHDSNSVSLPVEKSERVYNPLNHRSHLLHAIEGLHRYPNYLSRWNNGDVEALEQELRRVLQQVQEQKSKTHDQRDRIQLVLRDFLVEHPEWKEFSAPPKTWDELREILDTRASDAVFRSPKIRKMVSKIAVDDVIAGKEQIELDAGYLEEWMDEEMFDVYSFPLLSKTFCRKLCLYASSIISYLESSPQKSDNPVRSCYRDLDNLGLGWLNDLIFNLILRPVSAQLYRDTDLEGGDLDWRHGFIAAYSGSPTTSKPRQRLVPHTDDAEVTLNMCFGDEFDGGNLKFWGVRGDQTAGKFVGEYQPEIGRAILHSGRHLHEVTEITSGDRFALIQWEEVGALPENKSVPAVGSMADN